MTLTVLKGGFKPKIKPDYLRLYEAAFNRKIDELGKYEDWQTIKQTTKQIVFYGIKYLSTANKQCATKETLKYWLLLANDIKLLIGLLTPTELMQIFPVTKGFKGAKWQCKDYFYTMDKLREHGLDKPIGEAIDEILWDYMNPHLQTFTVTTFSIVDGLRRLDGQRGMLEEFAEQQGTPITMHRMYTDSKSRQYLVNGTTGKVCKVSKKEPRYLRVVKD